MGVPPAAILGADRILATQHRAFARSLDTDHVVRPVEFTAGNNIALSARLDEVLRQINDTHEGPQAQFVRARPGT